MGGGERSHDAELIRAGEKIVTNLSPHIPPHATLPPSAAPKRDHDEWLVRWRPGGLRVAAVQAETITARTGSPVKPLVNAGWSGCRAHQGWKVSMHKGAG